MICINIHITLHHIHITLHHITYDKYIIWYEGPLALIKKAAFWPHMGSGGSNQKGRARPGSNHRGHPALIKKARQTKILLKIRLLYIDL